MNWKFLCKRRARSRSTWACELKCFKYIIWQSELKVTLHVSVWVEILFAFFIFSPFLSRSTWACELKCCTCYSWQWGYRVTLHVSVWVEIQNLLTHVNNIFVTLHVSVWVEIVVDLFARAIAESRSTWACELKWQRKSLQRKNLQSRSTWACELKWRWRWKRWQTWSHAPRERVSWNNIKLHFKSKQSCHAPRERVSWNAYIRRYDEEIMRHAPRERVSWNNQDSRGERVAYVTLHVSVWVEIIVLGLAKFKSMSRSTWACELKFDKSDSFINDTKSHAPRERVSWNASW